MKWKMVFAMGVGMTLASSAAVAARQGKGAKDVVVQGKTIGEWIKALDGKDANARSAAVSALSLAGPEARRAAPALVEVFADTGSLLGLSACFTLKRIGP